MPASQSRPPLCLVYLGFARAAANQAEQAKLSFERALAIDERAQGPDHPRVARDLLSLAAVLLELGKVDEARPLFERALTIHEKVEDHTGVAKDLWVLATVSLAFGQLAEARSWLERALPSFERIEDHLGAASAAYRLGEIHGREGGWETARRLLERGLKLAKRTDQPLLIAEGYRLLGDAALHGTDYEDAQLYYKEAIRRWDALDRPREAADARLLLVNLLIQLGRGKSGAGSVDWLRAYLARPELSPEARREIEDVLRLADAADAQARADREAAT